MGITRLAIFLTLATLFGGCVVEDRDTQFNNCVSQKKGITARLEKACSMDPVYTDCATTEGSDVIGSGCTRKYEGKTQQQKEQICLSSVASLDSELEIDIIRSCSREYSRESIERQQTIAFVLNLIFGGALIAFLGFFAFGIFLSTESGSTLGDGVKRQSRGAKSVLVSNTRKSIKNGLLDSDRYRWIIENCRDAKARQHICKNDYQTLFRELAVGFIEFREENASKISDSEVIELLTWAVSVIPSVYSQKDQTQGEKRAASYHGLIEKIQGLGGETEQESDLSMRISGVSENANEKTGVTNISVPAQSTSAFAYYLQCWNRYLQFSGRAGRSEYWYWVLFNVSSLVLLSLLDVVAVPKGEMRYPFSTAYLCLQFFPNWSVSVRRLHDMGKSGWWILFGLVPIVGFITLTVFTILGSEPGSNRYGPNPLDPTTEDEPANKSTKVSKSSEEEQSHVAEALHSMDIGAERREKPRPLFVQLPLIRIMLALNILTYAIVHSLTFGAKAEGVKHWGNVMIANGWFSDDSGHAADTAYELTKLYPDSNLLTHIFRQAAENWQAEDGQTRFLTPTEKTLYEEIRRIPVEDAKANYLGYQRLRRLNPESEFYLQKMKFYRSEYKGY